MIVVIIVEIICITFHYDNINYQSPPWNCSNRTQAYTSQMMMWKGFTFHLKIVILIFNLVTIILLYFNLFVSMCFLVFNCRAADRSRGWTYKRSIKEGNLTHWFCDRITQVIETYCDEVTVWLAYIFLFGFNCTTQWWNKPRCCWAK